MSQGLLWLSQFLSLFSLKQINIPTNLKAQVERIDQLLLSDVSGLVNSLIDFSVSAAEVDFSIETSNKNLSKLFNSWLNNINSSLRGKVPTGISSLAKQYYLERWLS